MRKGSSACVVCKETKSNTLFSAQQLKNLIVNRTCNECSKATPNNLPKHKKTKPTSLDPIQEEFILSKIPKDTLRLIFKLLHYRDHFLLLGVSKQWNRLISEYLSSLNQYHYFLQNWKGNREALLSVLKKVPNIESIHLINSTTYPFKQHHFINLSKMTFLRLEYLSLPFSLITNLNPIIPLAQNLEVLNCSHCPFLNNISGLGNIAKYYKLEVLQLNDSKQIPKDAIEVISKLTSLKRLSLGHLLLGDEQLAPLSTLANLQTLDLEEIHFSAPCISSLLKHYPHLQSLSLASSKMKGTHQELVFQHISTQLYSLSIDFCDWVNDAELRVISKRLCYLESLAISGANNSISDEGCAALSKMTQLLSLFIHCYNPLYTQNGVKLLTDNITNCIVETD